MISVAEALRRIEEQTRPLETVEVSLDACAGRVLAEVVRADRDFPPTDRSAMDGFALRSEDVSGGADDLRIIGEIRAGQPLGDLRIGAGQAARIMTGAIVPPGADAVVMVEKTTEGSDRQRVRIEESPRVGQHIRRRAEDRKRGEPALSPGRPLHAAEIAALASVGQTHVRVHRTPVVHLLSTGDEIVEPEFAAGDHQVRNSNAYALRAQLDEIGVTGEYLGIAGDESGVLQDRLDRGLAGDVLLISGGVSAGDYDLVGQALASAGMQQLFHKVAVKPGKPILVGRRAGCLVFGLPGNPVSTFATFVVFVAPALRRLSGYRRWENQRLPAVLTEPLRARAGRETYHLARIDVTYEGLAAKPLSTAGSGDVLALSRANGFLVTPETGASLAAGAAVQVVPWRDFDLR